MQNSSGMGELAGPDQLTLNMLLPNSVILWIAAVVVFIRSVLRNKTTAQINDGTTGRRDEGTTGRGDD